MGGVQLNKLGTLSEKQGERQPKEKDWDRLTGVMKKNIAEKKIAFKINERRGGTLFLCDVDGLDSSATTPSVRASSSPMRW